MAKRFFFTTMGILALAANPAASFATIVDVAGVLGTSAGSRLVAIDDAGSLWRMTNDCEDWRLVTNIPGARALDFDGVVTAIITATDLLLGQFNGLDAENWSLAATIPLPASDIVDIANVNGSYWLADAAGRVWIGDAGTWTGPCSGPPGPVPVVEESFGTIKDAFRR